jgi:hypothetical protein
MTNTMAPNSISMHTVLDRAGEMVPNIAARAAEI